MALSIPGPWWAGADLSSTIQQCMQVAIMPTASRCLPESVASTVSPFDNNNASMCCCAVHIYLCDDAPPDHKEEYKGQKLSAAALRQELVDKLYDTHDIPVIRVTRKKEKSANPKSDNLNNCLKQIYGEGQVPPESEVIAVFDADQAAHSHFFTATLPWMDSGDDVGLVQSPQVQLTARRPVLAAPQKWLSCCANFNLLIQAHGWTPLHPVSSPFTATHLASPLAEAVYMCSLCCLHRWGTCVQQSLQQACTAVSDIDSTYHSEVVGHDECRCSEVCTGEMMCSTMKTLASGTTCSLPTMCWASSAALAPTSLCAPAPLHKQVHLMPRLSCLILLTA